MEHSYPLLWPPGRPRTRPENVTWSRFDVTPGEAKKHMLREIDLLGGRAVVISTDQRVRRDGSLYASDMRGNVADAAVAVYFDRKERRVCFCCDRYCKVWENMRAIGKTIEAMRGIERWGSAEMLDLAFTGFAALPPPSASIEMSGTGALPEPWWVVLGVSHDATWAAIRTAYRERMREADDAMKYDLNAAYEAAFNASQKG